MKQKELKDYTYTELLDYLTGESIMSLGRGDSLKSIISYAIRVSSQWTAESVKEKNKNDRKN